MKFLQSFNLFQKKKERLYTSPEHGHEDIFPFKIVEMTEIPVDVQKILKDRRDKESHLRNSSIWPWEEILKVEQPNITTYIASHHLHQGNSISRTSHFIDFVANKVAGEGKLNKRETEREKYVPYPEWTSTESADFQRRGLGERRLALMHAYSQRKYKAHLYSNPSIEDNARKLWQKLVDNGRAEPIDALDYKNRNRFKFLK